MLKPIDDRVVLQDIDNTETKSGIIIPKEDTKNRMAKVIAVAEKVESIKPDDIVIYNHYSGNAVNIEHTDYIIMREADVLAVVED